MHSFTRLLLSFFSVAILISFGVTPKLSSADYLADKGESLAADSPPLSNWEYPWLMLLLKPGYTFSVNTDGTGCGTVSSLPEGIDCGNDCEEEFDSTSQMVTLTATADPSSTFTGWSDPGCPGTDPCQVTMDEAKSITATFTLNTYPVTLNLIGGSLYDAVFSSAPTTYCSSGNGCSPNLLSIPHGTTLSFQATTYATPHPQEQSVFTGWAGGGCSGTGICEVVVESPLTIDANFSLISHSLNIISTGSGSGKVTSSLPGIDCGTDCTESYETNTNVTLSAVADPGSSFVGWSDNQADDFCSGTGSCSITILEPNNIVAVFTVDVPSGNEVEPNNSQGTSNQITLGNTIGGTLSSTTDEDWFVLNNDTPRSVTLSLAAYPHFDSYFSTMRVYDSENTLLAQFEILKGQDFNINFPSAGLYYFSITSNSSTPSSFTYDYQLLIQPNNSSPLIEPEAENNDLKSIANLLSFDAPATGQLATSIDQDWYVFSNDSPRVATLSFESPISNNLSPYLGYTVSVYSSDDRLLAARREITEGSFDVYLPSVDTYYLSVTVDSALGFRITDRQYTLLLHSNDGTSWNPSEIEGNDDKINATPINSDTTVTGIVSSHSDEDWFVFNNTTARTVSVTLSSPDSTALHNLVLELSVYNSSDTLLAHIPTVLVSNDYNTGVRINVSLPDEGRYYFVVSHDQTYSNRNTLQYHLALESNDGQQIPVAETENNDTKENADLITFETLTTGQMASPDDQDWFELNSDAMRAVTVSLRSPRSLGYVMSVYGSDNTLLEQKQSDGWNPMDFDLPMAGVYYFVVSTDVQEGFTEQQYELLITPKDN